MNTHKIAVAVDGPAGAGKSSISKIVAKKLGYLYIDTGAMYRSMEASDDSCKVFIAGQDVTDFIRTPQVNNAVSIVASYKGVRQYLVERQRLMAEAGGVILDGRDIGSVVLPNAELKIYLTASVEARAMRRYLEVKGTVNEQPLEDIKDSVMQRDDMDKNRKESPLIQVEDAVLVDSSEMTFDETVEHILHLVQERI